MQPKSTQSKKLRWKLKWKPNSMPSNMTSRQTFPLEQPKNLFVQRKETSHLAELGSYKKSLKNTQSELESLQEIYESIRCEKEALHIQCSSIKKSLVTSEDQNKQLLRELQDTQEQLNTAKVKNAVTVDRSRGLQIFSLTLSHWAMTACIHFSTALFLNALCPTKWF